MNQIFILKRHTVQRDEALCVSDEPDKLWDRAVTLLHGRDRRVMRNAQDDLTHGEPVALDGGEIIFKIERIDVL